MRGILYLIGIPLMVALVAVTDGCSTAETAEDVNQDDLVTVLVRRQTMAVKVNAAGTLEPVRSIEIKSKAAGQILRLPVEVGDRVGRGALLAQVDTTEVAANLRQSQAELDHARAEFRIADQTKQRDDNLLERGMISVDDHNNSLLDYTRTRSRLVNAETSLQKAMERRNDTVLRATMAGTILEKSVEEGQIIASPMSGVSEGTTLLKMADLSRMQVRVLVDETDIGRIRPGQNCIVTPDAHSDRRFVGEVLKIEPKAKKQREVVYYPVLIHIDNAEGLLLPDMSCKVTIDIVSKENALVVSTDALVRPNDAGTVAELLHISADTVKVLMDAVGAGGSGGINADEIPGWFNRQQRMALLGGNAPVERNAALVFVVDSTEGIQPRAVIAGIKDWDVTEISSGLEEGQVVLMPPSAMVAEQFIEFEKLLERFGGKLPGKK
jgi:HlyD family secretion protein